PATRVFEAAGAGACLITDYWEGIDFFFEPEEEILSARNGSEVAAHVQNIDRVRARKIGDAAYKRALAQHTYAHRAAEFDHILEGAYAK
ncbi:MAG: glycosyltransferase, partial [Chthoniobacterales bacterium]